ncbi:hypothetical protein L6164_033947 [Bauhinia variegata]|uniref:Uncharacterized protein n=1 Tax=Bauhinia variegata TaxID=167791 RepID=A0ACB9KTQ8_BAUVA|nr:hypothetical protein L6164_033947 [Bauhinia variegata]
MLVESLAIFKPYNALDIKMSWLGCVNGEKGLAHNPMLIIFPCRLSINCFPYSTLSIYILTSGMRVEVFDSTCCKYLVAGPYVNIFPFSCGHEYLWGILGTCG